MKVWGLAALSALAVASAAVAQDEPKDRASQTTSRQVTPTEIAATYPKAAADQKASGSAVLDCTADDQGREVDCHIFKEDPQGLGFGEAAMALVTKERVKTKDRDGQSIVGRRFLTNFRWLAPGDSDPGWMKKPTAADLAGVFPVAAAKKGVDGSASIKCQVGIEGFLQKCEVASETPPGLGFGAAALQLAPQFRMKPKIRDGKPVASDDMVIPILWKGFRASNLPEGRGNGLVLDPPWDSAPSAEQVRAAWPTSAKDAGSGQVALRCGFDKTGGLTRCDIISELPANRGFGRAARALSEHFKVHFDADQKKSLDDYAVDVPFRFRDPAGPDARKVTKPRWIRTLTPEGMAAIYPEAAIKAGVYNGLGVVSCTIGARGDLTDCEVTREDPVALDFGAAAIAAAKLMTMNPWSTEGEPMDGLKITLPIRFTWQETAAEAAATSPIALPAKP
jgi:TonB family protein